MRKYQWVVRVCFSWDLDSFIHTQYARTKGDVILYSKNALSLNWSQRYELARVHRLALPFDDGGQGGLMKTVTIARVSCPWGTCPVCARAVLIPPGQLTVTCGRH